MTPTDLAKIREEIRNQIRQLDSALTALGDVEKAIVETETNFMRAIDKLTEK